MPTYAYRCTECGHAFDIVQAFSDESLSECPQCGGRLRKVYGNFGVTFKGSGFYRTDSSTSDTSSASSTSGSSDSTSSSKTADSGGASGSASATGEKGNS